MRRLTAAAALLVIGIGVAPAAALAQGAEEAAPARARPGPTDTVELAAFLDGLISAEMKEHHVVGATVAVVRDGKLMYSKGYGWADFDERVPVDPATTLFRIGSITKLFTWTAVMQLVEQGKIDLDADVNEYLDFRIPDTYPGKPITMRNLMTHTPGFEDRGFGLFSSSKDRGAYLAENIPARVRPPGTYAAYSNYGAALAGYIVGRVSGQSWESYVRRHILEPLGMEQAAMEQPLPDDLADDMSVGYAKGGGSPDGKAFEMLVPMAPAGSGSASAEAMGHFMIAQLQNGEYEGRRIMADSTARLMHSPQFAHDPRLPAMDLGFYEQDMHGVHMIGHGGDTGWFHSNLALVPADSLGIFVSFNTASGGEISFGPFLDRFVEHYWPVPATAPGGGDASADLSPYVGEYEFDRMSYTTAEKAMGLFSKITVAPDPDVPGDLVISSALGKDYFAPAGEHLFRQVEGPWEVAFQMDGDRAGHFFISGVPFMAAERVPWYRGDTLSQLLLGIGAFLFLTALLAAPARWLLRKRFSGIEPLTGKARTARRVQLLAAALGVASLVMFGMAFGDVQNLLKGEGGLFRAALTLTTLTAVATIPLIWYAIDVWRHRAGDLWARIHYTAVTLGAVGFVWVLYQFNLLGWRL